MAYDLTYLTNRVMNDKLDDDSIDIEVIHNFLNDTQRYIFNNYSLPFMERIFDGVLPVGNYIFTFPSDIAVLDSVLLSAPEGSQRALGDNYMPYRDFNKVYPTPANNNPSAPLVWTTYAGKFITSSPTDSVYNLTVFYQRNPIEMDTGTAVPDLPRAFEEALVLGATYRAQERNEDYDLAASTKTDFTDALKAALTKPTIRQSAAPMVMNMPRMNIRRKRS